MTFPGTVVIVSFNSALVLPQCLKSVATCAPGAQTIVVDNASQDDSARIAATALPGLVLLRNDDNVGFGRGVNQALAQATGQYVLLLNPDCRLHPGALERLQAELSRHSDCAIVGPRILNEDGSVQGSARGDPTLLTGFFGRTTLLSRLLPNSRWARRNIRTDADSVEHDASYVVDWVSGACMLARRSALMAVDGFDERYFLYWEDADLCRRLRAKGHSIRYVPSAEVIHIGGASSRSIKRGAIRAFHQSAYTYYVTHVARSWIGKCSARFVLAVRCHWKLLRLGLTSDSH